MLVGDEEGYIKYLDSNYKELKVSIISLVQRINSIKGS